MWDLASDIHNNMILFLTLLGGLSFSLAQQQSGQDAGNPCTIENLKARRFHHAVPSDPRYYVQCTEWGEAHMMSCYPAYWDQHRLTCSSERPAGSAPVTHNRNNVGAHTIGQAPVPVSGTQNQIRYRSNGQTQIGQAPVPVNGGQSHWVANPTNPFKYYQCVNGAAVEKDCPTDHVWIQRDRECLTLKPTGGDGGIQSNNPCLGGQRYLPYPGNSNQYIECLGYYRQEIRQCPAEHNWSQEQSMCIPIRISQPPWQQQQPPQPQPQQPQQPQPQQPQQPAPQPQQPQQSGSSYQKGQTLPGGVNPSEFCQNTDSFYHPYPPSPTMYVQCDEFGAMYLRLCSPGSLWDDVVKTCIGTGGNQKGDTSGVVPTMDPKVNTGGTLEPFNCAAGSHWDVVQSGCVPDSPAPTDTTQCPPGMVWVGNINTCMTAVGDGTILAQVIPVNCPQTYLYDVESGMCTPSAPVGETNSYDRPGCDPDFMWDARMMMCLKNPEPAPFTLNDQPNGGDAAVYTLNGPVVHVGTGQNQPSNGEMFPPPHSSLPAVNGNGQTNTLPNTDSYAYGNMEGTNGNMHNGQISGTPTTVLTDMNGAPVHSSTSTDPIPVPVDENPCGKDKALYHPYPSDPRYFIQCDAQGAMFVHACGYSLVWDQSLFTCVPWSVMLSTPNQAMAGAAREGGDAPPNPCINSKDMFHEFPFNKYMYIMCAGSHPFMMPCPAGLVWDNKTMTCDRPTNNEVDQTEPMQPSEDLHG